MSPQGRRDGGEGEGEHLSAMSSLYLSLIAEAPLLRPDSLLGRARSTLDDFSLTACSFLSSAWALVSICDAASNDHTLMLTLHLRTHR